jgi:hypothetical protein
MIVWSYIVARRNGATTMIERRLLREYFARASSGRAFFAATTISAPQKADEARAARGAPRAVQLLQQASGQP